MSKKQNTAPAADTSTGQNFDEVGVEMQATPLPAAMDAELGVLVERFESEMAAAQTKPTLRPSLITAETRGVLILFPYVNSAPKGDTVYPVLKGHLDCPTGKIPVSAFIHQTDEGRHYCSLSIGGEGYEKIGGVMFRAEAQDQDDGKWKFVPGKHNERFGSVSKSTKVAGGEYETDFELRFYGTRKVAANGAVYIKAKVYAQRGDSAAGEGIDNCF